MTRSYRPHSKGSNGSSYQKHEMIKAVVDAQIAVAAKLLQRQQSALILDLHAGDGHGVSPAQGNLFGPQESAPTSMIALAAAERLSKYCRVGLRLFELNAERRQMLHDEVCFRNPRLDALSIEEDHTALSEFAFFRGFDYVLALSDPNGPKAAGTDVLEGIAKERQSRKLDVVAVVNVGALARMAGLSMSSETPCAVGARRRYDEVYWWHDKPEEWAWRLNRRFVVATTPTGKGAMQGRIFLVTNFAARPPLGFRFVFDAQARHQRLDQAEEQ